MELQRENNKKVKLLVVDDSLLIHKLITKAVESEGYEVCATAINGKQAVEFYEQYKPDIVTMDITMPVMGGIEATKKIREANPNANIVFFGSAIDKHVVEQASELGIKFYIDKPFEKEKLLSVLHSALTGQAFEAEPKQEKNKEVNNIIIPFFRALEEVMDYMANIQGNAELVDGNPENQIEGGYSTVLGFIGKVNGWVVLHMSKETACVIAERVNRETYEDKEDSFIGYSIQELGNIICGGAVKKINNTSKTLNLRLTPPGLFKGSSVSLLGGYANERYNGVFKTEFGNVNISIIFE
ncbi:MAG: response regulator [Deltaproteobacteria bacterium]